MPDTVIPNRPRQDVSLYIVEEGDTLFDIAEMFGLMPESILWGNYESLKDNPREIFPGDKLNIMPTNGTYHKWREGEDLQKVAEFYQVAASAILEWPGNNFDLLATENTNPEIQSGTMLIIPGGQREMIDYGPPRIPRDNPAIARTYGPGHCGVLTDGIIGDGLFIWPTAKIAVMGPKQMAGVMSIVGRAAAERRGLEFDEEADAKRADVAEHWAEERSKGLYATSRVSDDGMIDPRDTRTVVGFALSACHSDKVEGTKEFGTWRM